MNYECPVQQAGRRCELYESIRVRPVMDFDAQLVARWSIRVDGNRVATVTTGAEVALVAQAIHMGRHLEARAWAVAS